MLPMLVATVGFMVAIMGAASFASTAFFRSTLDWWGQGNRIYLAVVFRFVFGVVFVVGASECRWPGFVMVMGVVMLMAGVVGAVMGADRLNAFAASWRDRSVGAIKLWAAAAIAMGIAIVKAAA